MDLLAALGSRSKQPSDRAPRTPRADTRQAQVLALLRRANGATIAQIVETTGVRRRSPIRP